MLMGIVSKLERFITFTVVFITVVKNAMMGKHIMLC